MATRVRTSAVGGQRRRRAAATTCGRRRHVDSCRRRRPSICGCCGVAARSSRRSWPTTAARGVVASRFPPPSLSSLSSTRPSGTRRRPARSRVGRRLARRPHLAVVASRRPRRSSDARQLALVVAVARRPPRDSAAVPSPARVERRGCSSSSASLVVVDASPVFCCRRSLVFIGSFFCRRFMMSCDRDCVIVIVVLDMSLIAGRWPRLWCSWYFCSTRGSSTATMVSRGC